MRSMGSCYGLEKKNVDLIQIYRRREQANIKDELLISIIYNDNYRSLRDQGYQVLCVSSIKGHDVFFGAS